MCKGRVRRRAESVEMPPHGGLEVTEELWSQALGAASAAPLPQKASVNTQMMAPEALTPTVKTCRVLVTHQKAEGSAIPSCGPTAVAMEGCELISWVEASRE